MSFPYNLDLIKRTIKLLKEYEQQKLLSSTEFLDAQGPESVSKEVAEYYISLLRHKKFFNEIADRICLEYTLKASTNDWPMKTLLFLLIFVLNDKNFKDVLKIFKATRHTFSVKTVEFFLNEPNVVFTTRAGCRHFDNEYIMENVVKPLIFKEKLIKVLHDEVFKHYNKTHSVAPKEITTPVSCHMLRRKTPTVPVNTPKVDEYKFKPNAVPKTTYKRSIKTLSKINEVKDKNWEEALKLYEEAKKCQVRVAHIQPKVVEEEKICRKQKFANPPPKFTKVEVKKTTATLLREAACLAKEKEIECKKLEDLINGAFDPSNIAAVEDEIRKNKEQQNIQDIERKHLEGLLTFEEAVLAKKKLIQANQEKMEKFKEERVALVQELLKWKYEEQEKIKQLVEKSQSIERGAKESEKKMLEEKHAQAKLVDYESRKLLQEAYKRREEDLHEKVKLIQELRALHELRMVNTRQYDETECPNLGLLCEMSMAELRERLKLLKIQMREELEDRRNTIIEEKKRKEEFIDNVKEFVEQSRMCKSRVVPTTRSPKLVDTPEISALRERLQQAREMRKGTV